MVNVVKTILLLPLAVMLILLTAVAGILCLPTSIYLYLLNRK